MASQLSKGVAHLLKKNKVTVFDGAGSLAGKGKLDAWTGSFLADAGDAGRVSMQIRLREKGGAGGHNGMKSIINHLGQEFPRVRLGIGRPPGQMPVHAYVLQDFGKDDLPLLDDVLAEAIRAIETYLREGIQLAMSRHNGSLVNEE